MRSQRRNEKRVTAKRVRQRVSAVMRWAVAQGYREDNPAGEAIGAALPKNGVRPQHLAALPYAEVGAAIETVRASGAYRRIILAFEFLVLTVCRGSEVRGAQWSEIDFQAREWRVPAERMKAARTHRVPLSTRALAMLREASALRDNSGLVFPSVTGRRLSHGSLSKLVRDLGIPAVPHGFRSSFRDWAAECSDAPREVCELALAHVNSDRVEAPTGAPISSRSDASSWSSGPRSSPGPPFPNLPSRCGSARTGVAYDPAAMVKADLFTRAMDAADLGDWVARKAVEALFESLGGDLQRGDRVGLRRFGVFRAALRKTGVARNPRTGEPVSIARGRVVRFRPAVSLRSLTGSK